MLRVFITCEGFGCHEPHRFLYLAAETTSVGDLRDQIAPFVTRQISCAVRCTLIYNEFQNRSFLLDDSYQLEHLQHDGNVSLKVKLVSSDQDTSLPAITPQRILLGKRKKPFAAFTAPAESALRLVV